VADIAIKVTAKGEKAIQELNRVRAAAESLAHGVRSATATLKTAAQAAAAYFGVYGATTAIQQTVKLATAQANAEKRLAFALQQAGAGGKQAAEDIKRYAAELQKVRGVGDEVTIQAAAQAVALTGLTGPALKQVIGLSHDLAAVTEQDVTGAMMALAKAMVHPEEGLTRLRRAGIMLSDQQIEQIKIIQETMGVQAAQQALIADLTARVGGMAEALASPMKALKAQIGDLLESIGDQVMPYLNAVAQLASDNLPAIVEWLKRVADVVLTWGPILASIAIAWKTVSIAISAAAAAKAFLIGLSVKGLLIVAASAAAAGAVYAGLTNTIGSVAEEIEQLTLQLEKGKKQFDALGESKAKAAAQAKALADALAREGRLQKEAAEAVAASQKRFEGLQGTAGKLAEESRKFTSELERLEELHQQYRRRLAAPPQGLPKEAAEKTLEELAKASEEYLRLSRAAESLSYALVEQAFPQATSQLRAMEEELTALREGWSDAEREAWRIVSPLHEARAQLEKMGEAAMAERVGNLATRFEELSSALQAEKIRQSLQTWQQRLDVVLKQMGRLVREGWLKPEEALAALEKERERLMPRATTVTLGVMVRGGEFYRALAEAMARDESKQEEKQWRREAARYLAEIAANTREQFQEAGL